MFVRLFRYANEFILPPAAKQNGTRLPIRLTHEEIASACCTTRVTITRLINKLQQRGFISFDAKNHIIINDLLENFLENQMSGSFSYHSVIK